MNLLYNELTSLGFECVKPGGTFYIFPKALEEDAVAFSQKALKYDLVLVPSDSFGVTGYFRMAYCIDTALKSECHFCSPQIVIDRLRKRDHIQSLFPKKICRFMRSVSS